MKKVDLINWVAEMTGGTKVQAGEIVEGLFDAMAGEMAKGGTVDIAGFGKFTGMMRAARTARNPRTGEAVAVPATRVAKFKAAKGLKDRVAGH
ncbi:MAG: DNA-binding protein HU-beta [Planctomycetota bacterium]|jgi:DNA-binding protein HU-beta